MNPAEAPETTALAHLAMVPGLVRGAALIVGTVAAAAIAVFLIAISFVLGGRFPYRAVLFALGERLPNRKGEAPEPEGLPSSPVLVPSVAGGGD